MRRLTIDDIGMGALYFFASHMVIRSMFYVGAGRSSEEVALFFLVVLGAIALVHVVPGAFLAARLALSGYVKVPVVSALATLGAVLELLSILPVVGPVPFYLGGLCIGLACGWLVSIWMASFHVAAPDPLTFVVSPALLCAVAFYFAFRVASSVSFEVAEGLLLALPLVSIACLVTEGRDDASGSEGVSGETRAGALGEESGERRRASLVLVYVSASFALLSAVIVHIADKDGLPFSAGLNYMVLFELLLVAVVLACCYLLHWFACQRMRPHLAGPFVSGLLVVPAFLVGVAMGTAYQPEGVASLMWEISFWVMLVAVFAYDLRRTLFVGEGLAVGLMFEAMCVGQIAMQLVMHVGRAVWFGVAAGVLALAYLGGTFAQLLGGARSRSVRVRFMRACDVGDAAEVAHGARETGFVHARGDGKIAGEGTLSAAGDAARASVIGDSAMGADDSLASGSVAGSSDGACVTGGYPIRDGIGLFSWRAGSAPRDTFGAEADDETADVGSDLAEARYRELGERFGLTQSEVRILAQLSRGRSARYISDELGISFNTVRTHIRHVYEKTGIHSKQELIDLVEETRS